jgi:hypothetical protein
MIVAIHQPHFLPWLGYLHRMMQADLFVLLDHVQFERRNYQNRTQIRVDGTPRWLTVPVVQRSQLECIIDKAIDNPPAEETRFWGSNHYQTLKHAYRNAPFLELYMPQLRELLGTRCERLVDLNQRLLDFLRESLGIRTPLARSSELAVPGQRADLILNICREVGADTLIAGNGGSRGYLDVDAFERAGVKVVWHDFRHPRYPQAGSPDFIPGLSAVDLLFNCGPLSRNILLGEAVPQDACATA